MKNTKSRQPKKQTQNWNKLLLELIVVFLGVTAGFVLNNWGTHRQEKQDEKKYITGFYQDAEANLVELEEFIKADSLWLNRNIQILAALVEKSLPEDSAKSAMGQLVELAKIDFNTGTYENITNSGNLNIINNFETRTDLVEYHLEIDRVIFIQDFFQNFYDRFVFQFLISDFDLLRGEFTNPNILRSIKFSNMFAGYYSMVQQRLDAYKILLTKNKKLLKTLKAK